MYLSVWSARACVERARLRFCWSRFARCFFVSLRKSVGEDRVGDYADFLFFLFAKPSSTSLFFSRLCVSLRSVDRHKCLGVSFLGSDAPSPSGEGASCGGFCPSLLQFPSQLPPLLECRRQNSRMSFRAPAVRTLCLGFFFFPSFMEGWKCSFSSSNESPGGQCLSFLSSPAGVGGRACFFLPLFFCLGRVNSFPRRRGVRGRTSWREEGSGV